MINYLGKDISGAPIILHTIRNIDFRRIKDKEKFIYYQLYFYGVYIRDKMDGGVDKWNVLFDTADQGPHNTDFSVTRKIIVEAYKLFYGQPKLIIVFNLGLFTTTFIKILFPLLPKQLV